MSEQGHQLNEEQCDFANAAASEFMGRLQTNLVNPGMSVLITAVLAANLFAMDECAREFYRTPEHFAACFSKIVVTLLKNHAGRVLDS